MSDVTCAQVDELAAAYALGAVDAEEERAVSEHLATCDRPHDEARELIGVGSLLSASDAPVEPGSALRARLMTTIATTPQDHRFVAGAGVEGAEPAEARRPWWRMGSLAVGVAVVALAIAVGIGAWGLSVNAQLAERNEVLRAVANADAAYAATGSAGSGWVIESGGTAHFVAADLAALPEDMIYELWLLDAEGTPTAVGTVDDPDDLVIVPLEHDLAGQAAFAVTVEAGRVDAPTSDPVIVAPLES